MNAPFGFAQSQMFQLPLFQLSAQAAGRGVDWRLESAWPIDVGWVWLLGISLLLALTGLQFGKYLSTGDRNLSAAGSTLSEVNWRRALSLWTLRALVVVVLCWMLGGWRIARFETDLPDLVVLIDDSESMQLPSGAERQSAAEQTRWQAVVELVTTGEGKLLERLAEEYRLRLQSVGAERENLPSDVAELIAALRTSEPTGGESRLGDHLAAAVEAQRGRSTAAVVLLSDGVVTAGESLRQAATRAKSLRLPLIIAHTGSTEPPPQVALSELVAESTAMVGDSVNVMARIQWTAAGDQATRVTLIDQSSGRELASQAIRSENASLLASGGERSEVVNLSFLAEQAGLRDLRVRVEPLAGEVAVEDNEGVVTVDVRDDSFRVLLIQGAASYEFRFLKHLLERATNRDGTRPLVELISVLQQGDPRYADQDRAAARLPPVDSETLESLDLIILSDCNPAALGTVLQTKLAELVVERGVSLVVVAGPDHLPAALAGTPLGKLLPVEPDSVAMPRAADQPLAWQLTALGRGLPNLAIAAGPEPWNRVPPLYWLAEVERLRAGARVLLEAAPRSPADPPRPIVVSQLVGNGQVWLQLTDESFRLRGDGIGADYYERYWLQMVRALARRRDREGQQAASLDVLGERFRRGVAIPFTVQLDSSMTAAAGGQVEIAVAVTGDGAEVKNFTAFPDQRGRGIFQGLIEGLAAGSYRAVMTRPLGASDPPADYFVVQDDAAELRDSIVDVAMLAAVAEQTGGVDVRVADGPQQLLEAIPAGRAIRIRPLPPQPIWNHWAVASLLFGLLCGEWILRRRWGSF